MWLTFAFMLVTAVISIRIYFQTKNVSRTIASSDRDELASSALPALEMKLQIFMMHTNTYTSEQEQRQR